VPSAPRYPGDGRASWALDEDGVRTLFIKAHHPSLRRYFGGDLQRQDSQECRVLIAEILAEYCAAEALPVSSRTAAAEGTTTDAIWFVTERHRLVDRFLLEAHRAVVEDVTGEYE
jgi:hypothetical protein